MPVIGLVANNDGIYVAANPVASAVTGYSNREQIGDYVLLTKDGQSIPAAYAARAHVLPGLHLSLMRRS